MRMEGNKLLATFRKANRRNYRQWITSYLFLLPALLFFIMFVVYPMIRGVYMSFFDYNITSFNFIGLENYKTLFHYKTFHKSLINKILLFAFVVSIIISFSLFILFPYSQ